jgi:hypothetical protein
MSYYLVRPCKTSAAYEALPSKERKLDLDALEPLLMDKGFAIETNAEVVLVVTRGKQEVSIFAKGKLLIKVSEQEEAEMIAAELEDILF